MRIAVVANRYGNPWREFDVLIRRVAGALACSADVDVLLPGSDGSNGHDGAVRLLRFPGTATDVARRRAWRRALFGASDNAFPCACGITAPRDLPDLAEQELVRAEGGDAPALYEHLRQVPYELVVFVGYHSPTTCWGVKALSESRRFVVVPAAQDDPSLWLRTHDEIFERAELVAVCSQTEADVLGLRLGAGATQKLVNLGFAVGVNRLARTTPPHDSEAGPLLVMVGDWLTNPPSPDRILGWATRFRQDIHKDLKLCLVGPGAEHFPCGVRFTGSRLDVWRWVCRSVALLDPTPHRLLGQDVLEAMLFETAVITRADGGAAREHAELGNGGLWYRTEDELCAVVRALLDDDLKRTLGRQGRAYTEERYADSNSYVKRVTDTLLG